MQVSKFWPRTLKTCQLTSCSGTHAPMHATHTTHPRTQRIYACSACNAPTHARNACTHARNACTHARRLPADVLVQLFSADDLQVDSEDEVAAMPACLHVPACMSLCVCDCAPMHLYARMHVCLCPLPPVCLHACMHAACL